MKHSKVILSSLLLFGVQFLHGSLPIDLNQKKAPEITAEKECKHDICQAYTHSITGEKDYRLPDSLKSAMETRKPSTLSGALLNYLVGLKY